jgi:hypothetical protein
MIAHLARRSICILALTAACCRATAAVPATAPAASQTAKAPLSFSAAIAQSLNIPDTGADLLPALANVIAPKGDLEARTAARETLITLLLQGPHPTAIVDKATPLFSVGQTDWPLKPPRWTYGDAPDWENLCDYLWNRAIDFQTDNLHKATQFARASMMLAAMCDIDFGWSSLYNHLTADKQTAKKLLDLPDARFDQLQKTVDERISRTQTAANERRTGAEGIDTLAAQSTAPTLAQVQSILTHFDTALKTGSHQPTEQFEIILTTWRLSNLLKSRHSQDSLALVHRQLETWKHNLPDPTPTRWLDQALTLESPPPKKLVDHASGH